MEIMHIEHAMLCGIWVGGSDADKEKTTLQPTDHDSTARKLNRDGGRLDATSLARLV
jgi:hypothetical protein